MSSALLLMALTLSPGDGCGYGYSYGNYGGYSSQYGNWSYSPYYKYGYSYYHASYGYPAGYYYYNPPVYVAKYVPYPVYTPVAFTTYQPAALLTKPLGAIEQQVGVQATGYGVAAVPAIPTVNVGTVATVGVNPGLQLGAAAPSKCDQALAAIDARMAKLEAALMGQLPPPATQQSKKVTATAPASALVEKGKAVFVSKCSRCHAKADEATGKPQLFQDKEPLKLDCQTLSDCQSSVLEGSMPKRSEDEVKAGTSGLTQEDGQALMAYFVSESRLNKKAAKAVMPPAK